ncbi:hypothetical protein OXYTRIMIC_003 [Oxytricha trifallax]|uniref:Uncharacterized protein n=1 Tax=Oxytricha trifallax TaxID=1172189 RepID=A0A073IAX3_9SPIT|nr:hypothetical protein OXYTRIMIC_003 [Oxytricha trifallax]
MDRIFGQDGGIVEIDEMLLEEEENTTEEDKDKENKFGYQALYKEDQTKCIFSMQNTVIDKLLKEQFPEKLIKQQPMFALIHGELITD